jgi:PAS domain S-box-containing protein
MAARLHYCRAMKGSCGIVCISGALLLVALLVGVFTYRHEVGELERSTIEDLSAIRDLKADAVAEWRTTLLMEGELMRSTPALVAFARHETPHGAAHVADVLDWVRPNFASRQLIAVDVIAPGDHPAYPQEVQSLIAAARQGTAVQSQLSPLFRLADGSVRMAVVGPIAGADNTPTGFVVVLLADPTLTLFANIQQWPTPSPSGETLLVTRDGDRLIYLNRLRHRADPAMTVRAAFTGDQPAALSLSGAAAPADLVDYRRVPVLAAWKKIPNSDWALVSKIDTAEVFAPLQSLMWSLTITLAALVVGGITLTLWVTEKREITRLLQAKAIEHRLAVTVNAAQIGLWEFDVDTQAVYFSPEYKAQLGYRDDELPSEHGEWVSRLHPDDGERVAAVMQSYVDNPVGLYTAEFRLRHKDGGYRHILSRAQGEVVNGRLVRMLGCHIDITSTKELEAQLRHAQKMEAVGRLAGGIAHDFNNLLTVINGYVEFLLEDHKSGPLNRDLQEIQRAGKSAERLTRQLLVFSRTSRTKSKQTNVNQLLADWQRLLGRTLGDSVIVEVDPCSDATIVDVDEEQVEQVIMNLAVNAKDAMPAGGFLKLRTDVREVRAAERTCSGELRPGRYVVVSVQDTGTGIPTEVMPHVFEPFFTTKDAGKGTGLGLATVHGVMVGCGGSVCVTTSPQGTTFALYFPVSNSSASVSAERLPPNRPALDPKRVLVIDDDLHVREVIAREVARSGHIVEAGDINYAIAALRESRAFDVLVTDVVMPQMSGVELSELLKAKLPALRTVFITGYPDAEITSEFPADATVLRKPLSRGNLHAALERSTRPLNSQQGTAYAL